MILGVFIPLLVILAIAYVARSQRRHEENESMRRHVLSMEEEESR